MRVAWPLWFVTAMLAIGVGIEIGIFGRVQLLPKLPLALLLLLAFLRLRPDRGGV